MNINDKNATCDPISQRIPEDLPSAVREIQKLRAAELEVRTRLGMSKKLQELTLTNEIRWMRKHEDLIMLIASLSDWKSPDGVLQVKDLEWFKALRAAIDAAMKEPK